MTLDAGGRRFARGAGNASCEQRGTPARAAGHRALTLITFRDVPFNAPFYARLGFRTLAHAELTAELDQIAREESERGFARDLRVAMRCDLA